MQFGAFIPQGWRHDLAGIDPTDHWSTMTSVARRIEELGYDSLWVYDHFHTVPSPTQEVTYEAWTLMAALATVTDHVRLGQMCSCNSYRLPSYLAKVAASIDVISDGRVEMGIGAGWYQHEYDGYGYEFPKPSVRIGMLREGVEIMEKLWTEEEVDYEGKYYTLKGAISSPRPIQQPHIPFWVAGGGEKLTLNVAARYAQYTNFGIELDQFIHKSEVLRDHCEDVGTDFDSIIRSSNFNVVCGTTEAEVEEKLGWIKSHFSQYVSKEKAAKQVEFYDELGGTPEQIVERLRDWEKAGMTYTIAYFPDPAYDTSSLELFAKEVIPAFA